MRDAPYKWAPFRSVTRPGRRSILPATKRPERDAAAPPRSQGHPILRKPGELDAPAFTAPNDPRTLRSKPLAVTETNSCASHGTASGRDVCGLFVVCGPFRPLNASQDRSKNRS
jgi:hypothetical protein